MITSVVAFQWTRIASLADPKLLPQKFDKNKRGQSKDSRSQDTSDSGKNKKQNQKQLLMINLSHAVRESQYTPRAE